MSVVKVIKCDICDKQVSKATEYSIPISAPCWFANGHIHICNKCVSAAVYSYHKLHISDENYKRFGDIKCPDSLKNDRDWSGNCSRQCYDSGAEVTYDCKCAFCLARK